MPGNSYAQVLNTYATRRLLLAAIAGTLIICLIPVVIWFFSGQIRTHDDRLPLMFGVFLGFPALLIGAHLKQQLASHQASLFPGYRRPHLIIAASTFLLPILFAFIAAHASDGSIVGYVALLLWVFLAFFYLTANSGRLGGLIVVAVYLPALVPQLRIAVEQVLNGNLPGLAWCILSADVAFGILLFERLASLTEEDPSYGNVMPLNAWDMGASEVRRRNRAQLQRSPKVLSSVIDAASRRLDRLTKTPATTFRQRVSLQQVSGDWPVSSVLVFFMLLLMEGIPLLMFAITSNGVVFTSPDKLSRSLVWPISLSLGISWGLWLPQSQRWSRLGYESLRPATRTSWVKENGLAMIRQTLSMQGIWFAAQVILLFVFLPTFSSSPAIVNGLIYLLGAHIATFGAGAWISSFGSKFWKLVGLVTLIGVLQPSWLAMSSFSHEFGWYMPVFSGICATIGLLLTMIAYRRWCRIDLM